MDKSTMAEASGQPMPLVVIANNEAFLWSVAKAHLAERGLRMATFLSGADAAKAPELRGLLLFLLWISLRLFDHIRQYSIPI